MTTRSTLGSGRYVASELDVTVATPQGWCKDGTVPGIVYCHGATADAIYTHRDTTLRSLLHGLGVHGVTIAPDLGGDTFANDTGITRVGEAITYLRSAWNINPGPVHLIGLSMGAAVALAYTLAHPDDVASVSLMIPGLDLEDVRANNRGGYAASLNAAYGGTYDDATHGPTHSPVRFADDLPADLPIAMWTSSNDTAAVPFTATEFVTLRPQTTRTSMGAVGHTVNAAGVAGVVAHVRDHLS